MRNFGEFSSPINLRCDGRRKLSGKLSAMQPRWLIAPTIRLWSDDNAGNSATSQRPWLFDRHSPWAASNDLVRDVRSFPRLKLTQQEEERTVSDDRHCRLHH